MSVVLEQGAGVALIQPAGDTRAPLADHPQAADPTLVDLAIDSQQALEHLALLLRDDVPLHEPAVLLAILNRIGSGMEDCMTELAGAAATAGQTGPADALRQAIAHQNRALTSLHGAVVTIEPASTARI
ncbi:hypothetical protein ACN27G_29335 [Plantactinospora sp. WMMB334]|uniref:hypothetical protein n=1 Tax=Plantactinospora sp. WMMB334 TaxID=3404119 RepID=UPI003B9496CF